MANITAGTAMNHELLAHQAWTLLRKLDRILETDSLASEAISPLSVRKERIGRAHSRAYSRFIRRLDSGGVNRKVLISAIIGGEQ